MKVVQINTFPYKATGAIMMNIHQELQNLGNDSYVVWGRGRNSSNDREIVFKDDIGVKCHGIYTRITDKTGFGSVHSTKKIIKKLKEIKPDIIHLHNIHGYYINIELLFNYLKRENCKVVWTFHDCWPITGHCAYFDMIGCDKWKIGCNACPEKKSYPASWIVDNSKWNWKKKRELFTGLDITVVVPSQWLKNIVKESYLRDYSIQVINNGIDKEVFCGTKTLKKTIDLKKQFLGKSIILGVASEWTERKGLQDFIKLSEKIDKNKFVIVLVGLTKKQMRGIPREIIALERTSNIKDLVDIYTQADYFFNPTYDDNFPTTNLESIACGTPVITYKAGGSPETVESENGWIVDKGDISSVLNIIQKEYKSNVHLSDRFKKEEMIKSYIQLYSRILGRN